MTFAQAAYGAVTGELRIERDRHHRRVAIATRGFGIDLHSHGGDRRRWHAGIGPGEWRQLIPAAGQSAVPGAVRMLWIARRRIRSRSSAPMSTRTPDRSSTGPVTFDEAVVGLNPGDFTLTGACSNGAIMITGRRRGWQQLVGLRSQPGWLARLA